jgi:protoporphyrinogen oxidase
MTVPHVAIIGGGVSGLTVGYRLIARGIRVTVLDQLVRPGGLAIGFPAFPGSEVYIDKFYHHLFREDSALIGLIQEVGLGDRLVWRPTRIGFAADGRIYPLSRPWDLLRFRPIPKVSQRLRLGLALWDLRQRLDWSTLDGITTQQWLERRGARMAYERVWAPLLRAKFATEEISAAFLWGRVHPRIRSRSRGGEALGYLLGGFQQLYNVLTERIRAGGGEVRTSTPARELRRLNAAWTVRTDAGELRCDAVVATAPLTVVAKITRGLPDDYVRRLGSFEYVAAWCLLLALDRRLSDYYWVNNLDPAATFGVIVEHTNLIGPEHYGGRHLVYVNNYLPWKHPWLAMSTREALEHHRPSIERVFPQFKSGRVLKASLFVEPHASPVYSLGYAARKLEFSTPLPGLYVCGIHQVYPEDRNQSHCAVLAERLAAELCAKLVAT